MVNNEDRERNQFGDFVVKKFEVRDPREAVAKAQESESEEEESEEEESEEETQPAEEVKEGKVEILNLITLRNELNAASIL